MHSKKSNYKRALYPRGDRQFVTALARGLDILRCFDKQNLEIHGKALAKLTGLPQPTVWRLCNTMVRMGYLLQVESEKLRPGIPLLRAGRALIEGLDLPRLARPILRQLAEQYHAETTLAVYHGELFVLESWQSDKEVVLNVSVGDRLPLDSSASGWAYLAAHSKDERMDMLKKSASAASAVAARAEIQRALDQYKKTGFLIASGIYHRDYNVAAAAVRPSQGNAGFVVTCGGTNILEPLLRQKIGPELVRAAEKLTAEMSAIAASQR